VPASRQTTSPGTVRPAAAARVRGLLVDEPLFVLAPDGEA
jgi:hypothetical protein